MAYEINDTIAAIASAPGNSLRGIVRVSGETAVKTVANILCNSCGKRLLQRATNKSSFLLQANIHIPDCKRLFDVSVLVWPTKRSYAGQPSVEIHAIGSQPLLQFVMQCLIASGCRIAEPGEFTMRAFLSGRLDLTQAEAVLGIIDARNEQQFHSSLAQMAGGIAEPITGIKDRLVGILAELEAGLDFVEEDIEFISSDEINQSLSEAVSDLRETIKQIGSRGSTDEVTRVVLAGRPNAGKSSLFNALTGESAIVSEVAGTTRDYLTADVTFEDIRLRLVDTAGVEPTERGKCSIEQQMQSQAEKQIFTADILLHCVALQAHEEEQQIEGHDASHFIVVNTKADLCEPNGYACSNIATSVVDGRGIVELKSKLASTARQIANTGHSLIHSELRTTDNLRHALQAVESARTAAKSQSGEEIVAAEIRSALDEIGRIVGTIYTDDILDVVFSRFCIGK